jgi:hypothetical protein
MNWKSIINILSYEYQAEPYQDDVGCSFFSPYRQAEPSHPNSNSGKPFLLPPARLLYCHLAVSLYLNAQDNVTLILIISLGSYSEFLILGSKAMNRFPFQIKVELMLYPRPGVNFAICVL